jgi:hypothetical protein
LAQSENVCPVSFPGHPSAHPMARWLVAGMEAIQVPIKVSLFFIKAYVANHCREASFLTSASIHRFPAQYLGASRYEAGGRFHKLFSVMEKNPCLFRNTTF